MSVGVTGLDSPCPREIMEATCCVHIEKCGSCYFDGMGGLGAGVLNGASRYCGLKGGLRERGLSQAAMSPIAVLGRLESHSNRQTQRMWCKKNAPDQNRSNSAN